MSTLAASSRQRGGSSRTLAIGISTILGFGLATGLLAEFLTPDQSTVEAAASDSSPQQQRDSETKQSLVAVSEAVETYYVRGSGPLTLEQGHTEAVLRSNGEPIGTVKLADGTRIEAFRASDYSTWCIAAVNESGTGRTFSMSAEHSITEGTCA